MVTIIVCLQDYVPTQCQERELVLTSGVVATVRGASSTTLGDQLTVVRGRGAQGIRMNGGDAVLRLEGLHMFALDWHTKMNFLEVRNKVFVNTLLNCILHYINS